jgi:cbb3-type cytochrome oxidase maturation protein
MAGLLILTTVAGLTVVALLAFGWAVKNGQFSDFEAGARSIFDEEEPVGTVTDAFPDEAEKPSRGRERT